MSHSPKDMKAVSSKETVADATESLPAWWDPYSGDVPTYRIFVRDLVLPALIGIYPHEQGHHQRVRIHADIEALDIGPQVDDNIDHVLSYEDVVCGVKNILADGHIGLVETLAERIASLCLSDERCLNARIRVEKLDAFAEAGSVGVEIERTKDGPYPIHHTRTRHTGTQHAMVSRTAQRPFSKKL